MGYVINHLANLRCSSFSHLPQANGYFLVEKQDKGIASMERIELGFFGMSSCLALGAASWIPKFSYRMWYNRYNRWAIFITGNTIIIFSSSTVLDAPSVPFFDDTYVHTIRMLIFIFIHITPLLPLHRFGFVYLYPARMHILTVEQKGKYRLTLLYTLSINLDLSELFLKLARETTFSWSFSQKDENCFSRVRRFMRLELKVYCFVLYLRH